MPAAPQEYCTDDADPHLWKVNRKDSPAININLEDHLIKWFEAVQVQDRAQHTPGPSLYQVCGVGEISAVLTAEPETLV